MLYVGKLHVETACNDKDLSTLSCEKQNEGGQGF